MADAQVTRIIELGVASSLGLISSLVMRWYEKRKTKVELVIDETNEIAEAAGKAVEASGQVVGMLKDMLAEQSKHFNEQIERAKTSCSREIEAVREEYGKQIEKLVIDNVTLRKEIDTLKKENQNLNTKITFLTTENLNKDDELFELKTRLSKYEKENEKV